MTPAKNAYPQAKMRGQINSQILCEETRSALLMVFAYSSFDNQHQIGIFVAFDKMLLRIEQIYFSAEKNIKSWLLQVLGFIFDHSEPDLFHG